MCGDSSVIWGSGIADAVRGENLRFFPELRHRVAKMLRVLAYDSGGAALPELLRPGKEGCVPWLVNELGNISTHWCTRAELAAVLGSLARIPALSAAMVRFEPLELLAKVTGGII